MSRKKMIPLSKQSKRKQREYHASRRGGWGGLSPVTRTPPDPKVYNRSKQKDQARKNQGTD